MNLFECPRLSGHLRITEFGCANNWKRARREHADRGHALYECRGCSIGAGHAGEPTEMDAAALDGVCVRCNRHSTRLLKGHAICVSCYNREREVRIGKDRRGRRPKSLPTARRHVVTASDGAGCREVAWSSASAVETLLYVAKVTRGSAVVSRAVVCVTPQMTFFGAV